jgi:lipopolysaccharide export system permease protein
MKIIDRYVISSFIKNYLISFMVLVGMYVVLDMVFNFSNLVQQGNGSTLQNLLDTLYDIGNYYFYQCFLIFVQLSGIIPVVAAAFTLMRLSRFNELTALLAAGMPLLRVSMPIIVAALILNSLVLVDQEVLIPRMIPQLTRDHGDIRQAATTSYEVQAMQDTDGGLLYAARYFPGKAGSPPTIQALTVIQRSETTHQHTDASGNVREDKVREPYAKITADWAFWDAKEARWNLSDVAWDAAGAKWVLNNHGERATGLRPTDSAAGIENCDTYASGVNPEEIGLYHSGNFVDLLSTERIDQLLARSNSFGELSLWRVKHWRFTQPLMNVILLLLAIPCVLTPEPRQLKAAATKTLILTGIAMGSVFLSQQLAATVPSAVPAYQWTALMAWLPVFIFGPVSVYLLDRVKS